jgi:hypothetical protein
MLIFSALFWEGYSITQTPDVERFLAYFDLFGFKKFIENNDNAYIDARISHFASNIERVVAGDKYKDDPIYPLEYDISETTIKGLNFSDTVVFLTSGNSFEDFYQIVSLCFSYNFDNVCMEIPSRGCLLYGDISFKEANKRNNDGGLFVLNMIYGKAHINAHLKAENMNWAGCIIDHSAIEYAQQLWDISPLLRKYTFLYDVPYKPTTILREYAIRLLLGYKKDDEYISLVIDLIKRSFTRDKKGTIEVRVEEIFNNTIAFLKVH